MANPDDGIIEILLKLNDEDLFSLSRTVTQGLLKINTTNDAIKGIIKYSPDVLSILRRKIVTRDLLFSYLDEKNISIKLPTTKNDIIDKIAEYWNISRVRILNESNSTQEISTTTEECTDSNEGENGVCALAEQFSKWFYSMVNGEGVGSEHFYPDAKLTMTIYSNDDCDTTVIENNPEEIVQALNTIKLRYNLFFNPNTSKEGIQGQINPHGLVMVFVCGTLHIQDSCAGVFEQIFALARDPFCDNNWKIKNTKLNLRSQSGVINQPRLCDGELTSNLLMLPPG